MLFRVRTVAFMRIPLKPQTQPPAMSKNEFVKVHSQCVIKAIPLVLAAIDECRKGFFLNRKGYKLLYNKMDFIHWKISI